MGETADCFSILLSSSRGVMKPAWLALVVCATRGSSTPSYPDAHMVI